VLGPVTYLAVPSCNFGYIFVGDMISLLDMSVSSGLAQVFLSGAASGATGFSEFNIAFGKWLMISSLNC